MRLGFDVIPRVLHRIWLDEEVPERYETFWRSLQELHPGWEFVTWDDSSKLDWLRCRSVYDAATTHAGRSDVLRYEIIAKHGGVYVDCDVEGIKPFDPLLADDKPFIAWENTNLLCPTVIGAPPEHPALSDLLDALPAWEQTHRGTPPNIQTGPEFITAAWRERDDVRRLPPSAFYPIGWWEKHLLGKVAYPPETYSVHHWDKGWAKDTPTTVRKGSGKVSILVPFRDVDGTRSEPWNFVRERLERLYPEAEIVVASDDGQEPFHKTAALNKAAAQATGDVFVIYDSDTLVDIDALRETVAAVEATPMRWALPYRMKIKLNAETSRVILDAGVDWGGTVELRGQQESRTSFNAAPPLVVSRQAWETVRGMDERFRGWGYEDTAFASSLDVLCGRAMPQRRNEALHLNHAREGVSGNDLWPGQTLEEKKFNIRLNSRYRAARSLQAMHALLEERDDGRSPDDRDGDGEAPDRDVRSVAVG